MTELHIFFKTLALLLIAPAVLAVDVRRLLRLSGSDTV